MTDQKRITVNDPFTYVNKVNDFINSLGYETGNKDGFYGNPLKYTNGISVLFKKPNPNLFDMIFWPKARYIHCYLEWIDQNTMSMSVPGRGKYNSHLNEMVKLAEQISDHFGGIPISVELRQEKFESTKNYSSPIS